MLPASGSLEHLLVKGISSLEVIGSGLGVPIDPHQGQPPFHGCEVWMGLSGFDDILGATTWDSFCWTP